jgi:hypothetical protein
VPPVIKTNSRRPASESITHGPVSHGSMARIVPLARGYRLQATGFRLRASDSELGTRNPELRSGRGGELVKRESGQSVDSFIR